MAIEVVPREGEVMVECSSFGIVHVMTVRVDSQMGGGLALAYVLRKRAQDALS